MYGIVILFICWFLIFLAFVGFTSLDDSETRFRELFLPNIYIGSIPRFKWPPESMHDNFGVDRPNWLQRKYELDLIRSLRNQGKDQKQGKSVTGPLTVANQLNIRDNTTNEREGKEKSYARKETYKDIHVSHPVAKNKTIYSTSSSINVTVINLSEIISHKKSKDYNFTTKSDYTEGSLNVLPYNPESPEDNITKQVNNKEVIYPLVNEPLVLDSSTKQSKDTVETIYPFPSDSNAPGENGRPFYIKKENFTVAEKAEYELGWQNHQFNLFASDRISVRRSIPDGRSSGCKAEKFQPNLPTTSVIIVFHNEAWSTLLRTVHSIVDRSPSTLIKEIVLVDDGSTFEHLGSRLDSYMKLLKVVKVKRTGSRVGLMKARIIGAEGAIGDVLTFLDAHIECYPGWLEPLLSRIAVDNKTVVCPVIESIDEHTFQPIFISESSIAVGVFDWYMQFNWKMPSELQIKRITNESPIKTPAMAGGLFSIKRSYFYELGTYDPGMIIWGSENIEMSLRIWMCGGNLEIIPCSHVGHIFRKQSPYNWVESVSKVLTINQKRLVEVWLDEYKHVYYALTGNKNKYEIGDISDRMKLRRKLKCHSFRWYLKNIFPDLYDPFDGQFIGSIESFAIRNYCFDAGNENSMAAKLFPCHNEGGNQLWMISKDGNVRTINKCFSGTQLQLYSCTSQSTVSRWMYDNKKFLLFDNNNNCITAGTEGKLEIQKCSLKPPNINQKWKLKSFLPMKLSGENNKTFS